MTITIVGTGLIGGSLALDLRANGFAERLIGVEHTSDHAVEAIQKGLVDECMELAIACAQSDVVVLAVPVNPMLHMLPNVLDLIPANGVVIDMGSTKHALCKAVDNHPRRGRYVAAHPMAGTEYSGPSAAIPHLFHAKAAILCETERSDPDALKLAERLFKSLFMRMVYMNPAEHDVHAAYVSHISHITSYVLALTVLEKEKSEGNIFNMASGGFASTVRLAKSPPKMWRDIYEQNTENILDVLNAYIENMTQFRNLIQEGQFDHTFSLMEEANQIRRILPN